MSVAEATLLDEARRRRDKGVAWLDRVGRKNWRDLLREGVEHAGGLVMLSSCGCVLGLVYADKATDWEGGYDRIVRKERYGSQLPFLEPKEAEEYGFLAWGDEEDDLFPMYEALTTAWMEVL